LCLGIHQFVHPSIHPFEELFLQYLLDAKHCVVDSGDTEVIETDQQALLSDHIVWKAGNK
jgi:hypothetical protein